MLTYSLTNPNPNPNPEEDTDRSIESFSLMLSVLNLSFFFCL